MQRLTLSRGTLDLLYAEYSVVMYRTSSQFDILLCFETLASNKRHVSELLVSGFNRPVVLCRDRMPEARTMAAYVRQGFGAFCQPKFECGCCEMLFFSVSSVRQNLCV